jgi:hypothetical protein
MELASFHIVARRMLRVLLDFWKLVQHCATEVQELLVSNAIVFPETVWAEDANV